jgi:hypothetical protein
MTRPEKYHVEQSIPFEQLDGRPLLYDWCFETLKC